MSLANCRAAPPRIRSAPGRNQRRGVSAKATGRLGPSTKVTFYAGNNFTGGVVYQIEGPAAIVNDSLMDVVSLQGKKEFITNDWSGDPSEYVNQFPVSLRYLVKDSVFSWFGRGPASIWASKTGSFRVTCD